MGRAREIREATVKAYLSAIVRNLFLTRRKQAAGHVPIDDRLPDAGRGPDASASASREFAALQQQLATLGETDRRALLMRSTEGRSDDEIAAAPGSFGGRGSRARASRPHAVGPRHRPHSGEPFIMTITRDIVLDSFSGGRIHFFMLRDHPGTALFWLSAAFLWWQHVRLTRELTTAGL